MFRGVRSSSTSRSPLIVGKAGRRRAATWTKVRTHSEDRKGQAEETSFLARRISPKTSEGTGVRILGNRGRSWLQDRVMSPPKAQVPRSPLAAERRSTRRMQSAGSNLNQPWTPSTNKQGEDVKHVKDLQRDVKLPLKAADFASRVELTALELLRQRWNTGSGTCTNPRRNMAAATSPVPTVRPTGDPGRIFSEVRITEDQA